MRSFDLLIMVSMGVIMLGLSIGEKKYGKHLQYQQKLILGLTMVITGIVIALVCYNSYQAASGLGGAFRYLCISSYDPGCTEMVNARTGYLIVGLLGAALSLDGIMLVAGFRSMLDVIMSRLRTTKAGGVTTNGITGRRFCSQCGHVIRAGAAFCAKCGSKVNQ